MTNTFRSSRWGFSRTSQLCIVGPVNRHMGNHLKKFHPNVLRHSRKMTQVCSREVTHRPGGAGDDNALPTCDLRAKVRLSGWSTLSEHKWSSFGERRGNVFECHYCHQQFPQMALLDRHWQSACSARRRFSLWFSQTSKLLINWGLPPFFRFRCPPFLGGPDCGFRGREILAKLHHLARLALLSGDRRAQRRCEHHPRCEGRRIISKADVGGLHHRYERRAA